MRWSLAITLRSRRLCDIGLFITGVESVYMEVSTSKKIIIVLLVVVSLTVAGSLAASDQLPLIDLDLVDVPLELATAKTMVVDIPGKTLSPLSPKEYVLIDGRQYEVLVPWFGHRIKGAIDPHGLEFAMLPTDLALAGREIYVTTATRDAFVEMAAAAALDGVEIMADSGYRSVAYQRQIYQRKLGEGDEFYDIARGVAPPGYSEHMLGTVLDMVPSKWTFSGTAADKWLLENGADFAFIQSYPQRSDRGFTWEPWHWKYVGDI